MGRRQVVRHRVLVSTFLGSNPYWYSSLLACEKYLNSPYIFFDPKLYKRVPNTFKEIRPWVKYGWEMVLIVHEIIKKENPIANHNKNDFLNNYHQNCQRILKDNSWIAKDFVCTKLIKILNLG